MLVAENLSVTIGRKKVLADISVQIKPGELVAVIGANGAGKSTLLKCLCGEISPTSGEVVMNGKKLDHWPLTERATTCAVLPQNSDLSFPFSVLDVVLIGRSPHNQAGRDNADRCIAQQVLELIGMTAFKERIYTTLSGGERQRVQYARILAQIWEPLTAHPHYLLLDEPTAALDLSCQHDCLRIASRLAKNQGVGVLAILHDLNLAALYADRIVVLQSGVLIAADAPTIVLNKELIQRVFNYPVEVSDHPQFKHRPLVIPMLSTEMHNI